MTPEMIAAAADPAADEYPELEGIETEDGKPLDSFYQEKLHRILTESLYASWPGPGEGRTFRVYSNVGLFFDPKEPPLVPDVMLALGLPPIDDMHKKKNQSYFTWILGKPPDVVLEFVSNRRGGEATSKRRTYAAIGVPFYVIFDPKHKLSKKTLRIYRLAEGKYRSMTGNQLEGIGLGLVLWSGPYEGRDDTWLRWCDTNGVVIPTGKERGDEEQRRADDQQRRAERLTHRAERMAAKLRELGIDPDALNGT